MKENLYMSTWNPYAAPEGEEDEEVDDSELNLDKVEEEMAADYSGIWIAFDFRYKLSQGFSCHLNIVWSYFFILICIYIQISVMESPNKPFSKKLYLLN